MPLADVARIDGALTGLHYAQTLETAGLVEYVDTDTQGNVVIHYYTTKGV